MDNTGYMAKALEWGGAFIGGILGTRAYHRARIKSDTQEFQELKAQVRTLERQQSAILGLATTVNDHEARLAAMERRAERDHAAITRQLSRIEDTLEQIRGDTGR